MVSGSAPAPSAGSAATGAPAPSPDLAVAGAPASPDLAAAQPQQAGGGGGRPGWQLGVIVAAVLAGLVLAICVVFVPYIMVRRGTPPLPQRSLVLTSRPAQELERMRRATQN